MTTRKHEPSAGRYPKGIARRQQIIDTALEQFAEHGVDGASMRVLSEAIGVSTATLSHYFASRDELLVEVYRTHEQRSTGWSGSENPLDAIAETAQRNVDIPGLVRLYATLSADAVQDSHPATTEFVRARFRELRALLAERLRAAQRDGTLAADVDADDAAALYVAASDGLQLQWLLDPDAVDMTRVLALLDRTFTTQH